jgi:cardiolipin synthase
MRTARKALLIIPVAMAAVAVLLLVAQDQVTVKLRTAAGAAEPRHAEYVAALLGVDLTHGNRFTVLTNGDEIFPAMLAAIRSATRRISFESYIYEAGEMGDAFTRAFRDAARRGVRVNMVVDAVGASGIDDEHVRMLEEAGCRVVRFNQLRWYSLEEVNYRTHRKILVVDGAVAFTGGAGIGDRWMGDAQDDDHWRDTMVQIAGPAARLVEGGFYENFTEAAEAVAPELDAAVRPTAGETAEADWPAMTGAVDPPDAAEEGTALVVRSSPSGGANDMKRLYLLALAAARRTVDITTPYFVPDESSLWSLEAAVGRGVRIRLLVEGERTDAMPVKHASRRYYQRLLDLGVEIYEYQPTMLHAKTLVVDHTWSVFGSANFDNRSLELNDELNVAVSSRGLAALLLEDFERDVRASRRLTTDSWRARPLEDRIQEQFWGLFGEVF